MTLQHKRIVKIIAVFLLILLVALITFFLGRPLLTMVEDPEAFRALVEKNALGARLLFIGLVFVQVVLALIPGEPLEICAGIAFGSIEGTLLCLLGIFLGSATVFFLVRRFGVRLAEVFFSVEKIRSLRFLQNEKRLDAVLFLIMMIPGTPKDLISYFVPLTKIRAVHWLVLATLARIPSVVTSTVGGDAVGEGEYLFAAIVFAATCLVSLIGAWFFDFFAKRRKNKKNKS
ncbi:MAG: TVP38/TMEM64 family protein [Clostridia bacterium]|nr:TVP38/TMEM64 family protein [Clostridia bacterium]